MIDIRTDSFRGQAINHGSVHLFLGPIHERRPTDGLVYLRGDRGDCGARLCAADVRFRGDAIMSGGIRDGRVPVGDYALLVAVIFTAIIGGFVLGWIVFG